MTVQGFFSRVPKFVWFLWLASVAHGLAAQQQPSVDSEIPPELHARTPEVQKLLDNARAEIEDDNYAKATSDQQKALDIALSLGFVPDIALARTSVAASYFREGKISDAIALFHSALEGASEEPNLVLEADILVALSSEEHLKGNPSGALALLAKAYEFADRSNSLYIQSRVLGELGWSELLSGKIDQAQSAIRKALAIDELNHYRFQPLHLAYSGCVLIGQKKLAEAEKTLEQARRLSLARSDFWSFALAERALAFLRAQRKEFPQAIASLERLHDAKLEDLSDGTNKPERLRAALSTPVIRVTVLETLAGIYASAGQPDKATAAWNELYEYSKSLGLTLTEAEAAVRIADLKRQSASPQEAVKFYDTAIELFQTLQNEFQLTQALRSDSMLLIKLGRGQDALPLETRLADIAERQQSTSGALIAYLVMAEVLQPQKQQDQARDVLEKAAALLEPDTDSPAVDDKLALECYTRLAIAYGALGDDTDEVIARERAVHIAHRMKDAKDEKDLVAIIQHEFDARNFHDSAQRLSDEGKLRDALTQSEIIYVFEGTSTNDPNWNRIMNLPPALVKQPHGAEDLTEILRKMGPMLGTARLPILNTLSDFYQTDSSDLNLAERYGEQAEALLAPMNDSVISFKVWTVCHLALILAHEGSSAKASAKADECIALAAKTDDKGNKDLANAVNALVRAATNEPGATESTMRYFLESHSNDAAFHAQLATALAANSHYPEAVSEFETAIRLAEQQDHPDLAAATYLQMGRSLDNSTAPGDATKQLVALSSARDIYHRQGNSAAEARSILLIGLYFQKHGDYKRAMDAAIQMGESAALAHDERLIGHSAWLKGNLSSLNGNNRDALSFHQQAFSSFKNINDKVSAIAILLAEAEDQNALHDPDAALASCRIAESMSDAATPAASRVQIKRALGLLYLQQGEMERAVESFQSERDIAKSSNDLHDEGFSELSLSDVYQLLGRWQDASEAVQAGLRSFDEIKDAGGQASAQAELVNIYSDRTSSVQDFDKALSFYKEAERLGSGSNLKLDVIEVYLQKGLYREAVAMAKSSLDGCVKTHNPDCQAHSLISLSEAQRGAGDLKAAQTTIMRASDLVKNSSDFYLHGRLLYAEANLRRAQGSYKEAIGLYEHLISLVEGIRGQLDTNAQRSLSETYGFIYDELVEAFYSLGASKPGEAREQAATEAFRYAEANKAQQFAKSWGRTFANSMRRALPPAVQKEEQALNMRRNHVGANPQTDSAQRSRLSDPGPGASSDTHETVAADSSSFVTRLRTAYPQYAAVAYPEEIAINKLPLKADETLVECKVTDDAAFVWIVRRLPSEANKLIAFYEVKEGREWFAKRITPLRKALNEAQIGNIDWTPAEELFNALFPEPHAKELLESKSIIFVPDDVLFVLPFELLSPHASDGVFPLAGVPTRYYPSAAAMKLGRDASHQAEWSEAFLGIGDPVTSPNDGRYDLIRVVSGQGVKASPQQLPILDTNTSSEVQLTRIRSRGFSFDRLPGTAAEVRGIAEIFTDKKEIAETWLGFDATKTRLLETDLTRYRYLHFATHGILPTDTGIREPALVLSFDGSATEQMWLSMTDILGLRIRADSVVLSACNTGSGTVSRAEGVMSLGRAFLAAGASSVTVSLWQVSDESTARFMEEYYRRLSSGQRKDQALASARLWLIAHGNRDPFYWAPFILIGE